jgi:CheY-like chemotaxis protein
METRDVFFVAVTGHGQPEDRRRAWTGFDEHIAKFVWQDVLVRALRKVGDRENT